MKYKVETLDGKKIEVELKEHLTFSQRNDIMDKAVVAKVQGNKEIPEIHYGKLLQATIEAVVTPPEGYTIDDIKSADLDAIFQRYTEDFGLDKKKVMALSK
ncbi:MAG: hypothetical protein DRN17_02125 [Thermoplasmata archaeon]|nr:MAG: hypothetical protein DRN17_02125 [Thermoplasmata archaeon]